MNAVKKLTSHNNLCFSKLKKILFIFNYCFSEPPKDLCLYNVVNSNDVTSENLVAKKVGETWKDGPCVSCVCEKSSDELPKSSCLTTECPDIHSNPDFNDFVLEEKILIDQCCPRVERVACRNHDIIYNVSLQAIRIAFKNYI